MWDMSTNTSTTGQRKNKQGPLVQAESNGLKECHKTLLHFSILCNTVSRGICIKERPLTETRKHGLAEAGHKTRPRKGETPSNMTRERMASKLRETLIQTITRLLKRFPRIRELMKSSQPENKTLLRVSRLHSGTL